MSDFGLDLPTAAGAVNPANVAESRLPGRDRIPMSLPQQKLATPEIPGFHLHWMRGDPQRIAAALRAGYAFVEQDEVDLNTIGLGEGDNASGHQDLGSRVSFISGKAEDGGVERLYLMKLPQEYWEQDQAAAGRRQEGIAATLRGDKGLSAPGEDNSNRYAGKESSENRNIFLPKRRA